MFKSDIVLFTHKGKIFVELASSYMLYLCEEEVYEKLTTDQIVLLVDSTLEQHQRPTVQ